MGNGEPIVIYLDNAATTWPKPETVYRAVDTWLRNEGASPGRGSHSRARGATYKLYTVREGLADLFGIRDPNRVSFAFNATDALNTVLLGLFRPGDVVVVTAMEHNAVVRPLRHLEDDGVVVKIVGCDAAGRLDINEMKRLLAAGAKAVVMTHASNVTGTLQPVAAVGELTRRYGTLLIVDAAQTAGVEFIHVGNMSIDILVFSGHKGLLGPQGTGGLYVATGIQIRPLRYGGTGSLSESDRQPEFMPDCLESGTANTPGIAGLAAGIDFIKATGMDEIRAYEAGLGNQLYQGLKEIPGVTVYGPPDPSERTAVVSFTLGDEDTGMISHRLDQEFGVISRGGLHCAPWAHRVIGTLATGTVRFSPGYFNRKSDVEAALQAVKKIARESGRR
jgi:cysteine desulfurase family protein